MKLCRSCGQLLAEDITTCPACGNEVTEGRKTIDDYRIIEVLHEEYATILCRAVKDQAEETVMIRLFGPQAGIDKKTAERLKNELEELKKLPEKYFVRHLAFRQSSDGLWYRVSEWLDTENWGNLIASGVFQDYRVAFQLFYRIASILEGLHRIGHFLPHLILDDILVIKDEEGEFWPKIDHKLSRFIDPKLDRPEPMLEYLLTCHPDIIHQRALGFRSDIWSLGKIFVEILTAKHESTDFQAEIEALALPHKIAVMLKSMLANDPILRPQSMAEVAESLSRLTDAEIKEAMTKAHPKINLHPIKNPFRFIKFQLQGSKDKGDNPDRIIRSIEFPPEYHQAGISILTTFETVLRKKYPDKKVKIRTEQEGLELTMIIDPEKVDREIIEHALDEYGRVVTGQMPIEEYTDDKLLVLELKQELSSAQLFIEYMGSLTGQAFQFYSCFISHSTNDKEFAERIYADLRKEGVRCWFAPEDIKGGKKLHWQLDEAIRIHDKLLLILSEQSISSGWVANEIRWARKQEKQEGNQKLFPVSLMDYEKLKSWKLFDADTATDLAAEVRSYFIPDFANWKDHDSYQQAFKRLLKDLQATEQ